MLEIDRKCFLAMSFYSTLNPVKVVGIIVDIDQVDNQLRLSILRLLRKSLLVAVTIR